MTLDVVPMTKKVLRLTASPRIAVKAIALTAYKTKIAFRFAKRFVWSIKVRF